MKLCESCRYRNNTEYHKPCIVYRDDCEFYEREGDMTREEAIYYLQSSGFSEEQIATVEQAFKQEPCDDLISREAVLKAIDTKAWEFCDYLISEGRNDEQKPVSHFADNLRECVGEDLPPVTPQEPKSVLEDIKADIKEWYWQADKQAIAKDPCVVDAMIDLFIRTIDAHISGEP